MQQIDRLANYMARFPKCSVVYKATDMILKAMYDSALRPHEKHKIGSLIYHSCEDDAPEIIGNIIEVLCKLPPDVLHRLKKVNIALNLSQVKLLIGIE